VLMTTHVINHGQYADLQEAVLLLKPRTGSFTQKQAKDY